jgi:PAS domain S-box-containing protein
VDDEPGLLEIGKLFLEESGQFSVDVITSAPAALTLLNTKNYDAIISDYQMPGMDGIEFLKTVRASGNTIPFILFTGRGREEIVIQALNEGADFYLQKGGEPASQFAELEHQVHQGVRHRRAESSVRDHERREQDIINFLPDATIAIDKNGIVIAWNRALEEMTGIPASDMLGKGDYEYALPFYGERRPILIDLIFLSPDETRDQYSNIVRDGTMLAAETTLPRLRGEPKTLWGKASLLYDQGGNVVGAIESVRDITERKTAEVELIKAHDVLEDRVNRRTADLYEANLQLQKEIETREQTDSALQESEERFRTLIEKAPEAILLFDMDLDRYVEANAKAEQLFGCSRQHLLDSGPQQFYLPDQFDGRPFRETVPEHRKQALAGAELVFERRIRNAHGEDRIVEVRLVHLPSSTRKLIRSSYIDITERKRVEMALRESEERYRTIVEQEYHCILENIEDVFYRTDVKGNLILASPSGAKLLGSAGAEEIIGKTATDFYADPAQREIFLAALKKDGWVSNMEITLKRADGALVTVSTNSQIYYDASGNYAGVEGIFRNITRQKEMEETLQNANDLLNGVIESPAGVVIFALDRQYRYIAFNENHRNTMKQIWGVDIAPGTSILEYIQDPDDRAKATINFNRALAGESFTTTEAYGDTHLERRWYENAYNPIMDKNGMISGLTLFLIDITDRKQAEEALRESEEKYRKIIENAPYGMHFYEQKPEKGLVFTGANPGADDILGVRHDQFIGKTLEEAFPGLTGTEVPERYREAAESGSVWHTEQVLYNNGSISGAYAVTAFQTAPGSIAAMFMDITSRKRTEEALRESEEKFRGIFDTINDGIHIHEIMPDGKPGKFIEVNEAACRMLQYTREELLEHGPLDFVTEYHRRPFDDLVAELSATGHSIFETGLRRKDGIIVPVEINSHVVNLQGKKVGVSMIRDITEHKRDEDALRLANRQLHLLTGITRHDILNKVSVVRGYLKIAEMKSGDPAQVEYLKKTDAAIAAIKSQIEFTKVYQDLGTHDPHWIGLDTVMPRAHVPKTLTLDADIKGVVLFADPMLEKVFFNLLDNSIRYGEHVTEIRVSSHQSAGNLIVVWEDNGIGVATDEKERIFERGFGKNTGLGLFLVQEILALTEITIAETGKPGKGARFEITVPKGSYRFSGTQ